MTGQAIVGVDALYTIDTQTWTTNFIGNFQTERSPRTGRLPAPAWHFRPPGVLYVSSGGKLYTVDTNTARAGTVGAFPEALPLGASLSGQTAAYGGGTNLYAINPTNASVTKIGALNGVSLSILADMKYGADGFLYFCDGGSDGNLYRLNPANARVSVAANYPSALCGLAFVPIPTVLVAEPTNQIVVTGTAPNFSVTATGTAPLNYQWFFNNAAIPGGTNSVLTIPKALAGNNSASYVVVSNSLGPVTSSIVTLKTYTPPAITKAPKAVVITPGQTIALSVAATGSALRYQWQLNGTNLAGKTAASLTIRNARTNDAGTYTILVSSPFVAEAISASASVAVIPLTPVISSPANNSATRQRQLDGIRTRTGQRRRRLHYVPTQWRRSQDRLNRQQRAKSLVPAAVPLLTGTNVFLVWATNDFRGVGHGAGSLHTESVYSRGRRVLSRLFSVESAPALANAGYFNLTLRSNRVLSVQHPGGRSEDSVRRPV